MAKSRPLMNEVAVKNAMCHNKKDDMNRNPVTEFSLIAILAVAVFCITLTVSDSPFDNREFDTTLWRKSGDDKNMRGQMALAVCKKINEKPIPLKALQDMLGKPDDANKSTMNYDIVVWENGTARYYITIPIESTGHTKLATIKKAD